SCGDGSRADDYPACCPESHHPIDCQPVVLVWDRPELCDDAVISVSCSAACKDGGPDNKQHRSGQEDSQLAVEGGNYTRGSLRRAKFCCPGGLRSAIVSIRGSRN